MATPTIRADFEQLKNIATRFGSQAQVVRLTLQMLQQRIGVLQTGDWVGRGATAFYQEMDDEVMPTLKRLAAALESAQQTTLQISQIMAQAEADAARVLHGAGGDGRGVFGLAAGPVGGAGDGGVDTQLASAAQPGAGVGAAQYRSVANPARAGRPDRLELN